MKVIRLQSNNIMKLVAVDITPDGNMVIVGGKNGAGKSSVLNSLAMALGGAQLAPVEPIRAGEADAKIEVDLGDLKVTRRFMREKVKTPVAVGSTSDLQGRMTTEAWGETKSTLTVTNKEGAKYPSPQAMLDKLLGKLTFDPLAFSRDDQKRQAETLRKLVGLDVTQIENRRAVAFSQRAMLKKTRDIKEAQALALPKHDGVPAEETPMDAISQEMLKAEELRKIAEDAERLVGMTRSNGEQLERQRVRLASEVDVLTEQLKKKSDELARCYEDVGSNEHELSGRQATATEARAAVPDVAVIRAKLSEVEATNAKVRANKQHRYVESEVRGIALQIAEQDDLITKADDEKQSALESAKFPVPGLGLNDDGVTFQGLPFSQASSSEQLRVSVAIGLALNPTLKVLLIRSGNLLDDDSLKLMAEQADKADAQVWMEYVTSNPEGVSVFIEDGRVAEVEAT